MVGCRLKRKSPPQHARAHLRQSTPGHWQPAIHDHQMCRVQEQMGKKGYKTPVLAVMRCSITLADQKPFQLLHRALKNRTRPFANHRDAVSRTCRGSSSPRSLNHFSILFDDLFQKLRSLCIDVEPVNSRRHAPDLVVDASPDVKRCQCVVKKVLGRQQSPLAIRHATRNVRSRFFILEFEAGFIYIDASSVFL